MASFGKRLVVAINEVELLDDAERGEVIILTDIVFQGDTLVVLYDNGYGFGNADGVSQLNLAPIELVDVEQFASKVSCHVRSGAVNLGRVFPGEGTATYGAISAVLVAYDLATGQPAIGGGTANRPSTGGIDDQFGERVLSEDLSDESSDLRFDIIQGCHVLVADRNNDGMHRGKGRLCIQINRDLCFGIPGKGTVGVGRNVVFNGSDDPVGKVKAKGQAAVGLGGGIAKHNALVACADLLFRGDSLVDLMGLLADQVDHRIYRIAKFLGDHADNADIIDLGIGRDFAAEDDCVILDHGFDTAMAVSVLGKAFGQNGIRDLVSKCIFYVISRLLNISQGDRVLYVRP